MEMKRTLEIVYTEAGGQHNCEHSNDVSVSCIKEVRLVGAAGSKGRLEVYHDGIWGNVCDNGFTDREARVICYILGYGHLGLFIGNTYGPGRGRIWLDNVRCGHWSLTSYIVLGPDRGISHMRRR